MLRMSLLTRVTEVPLTTTRFIDNNNYNILAACRDFVLIKGAGYNSFCLIDRVKGEALPALDSKKDIFSSAELQDRDLPHQELKSAVFVSNEEFITMLTKTVAWWRISDKGVHCVSHHSLFNELPSAGP